MELQSMIHQYTISFQKEIYLIDRRVCTCCNIEKSFDEFGNSNKGKWGKREQCKDCLRIKNRIYSKNNPEIMRAKHKRWVDKNKPHMREYNRNRYEANAEIMRQRSNERRRKTGNKAVHDYRAKYPYKKKAHTFLEYAVFYGMVIRPDSCSKCDVQCKPQGHHLDYNKPLDVIWLCTKCHGKEHRINDSICAERLNEKTPSGDAIV